MRRIALAASLALVVAPAFAAEEEGVAVTVYSTPGGFDPNSVQNAWDPMTGQYAPVIPGLNDSQIVFLFDSSYQLCRHS